MKKIAIALLVLIAALSGTGTVLAEPPLFLGNFKLHEFDTNILSSLGYDGASIAYVRELASVTSEQVSMRQKYEPIGCNPYYVFQNGKAVELGFNCRSFFCVGYIKGPKICRDRENKSYGGVMEINTRLGLVTIQDTYKFFHEYPVSDQTSSMRAKIEKFAPYKCKPLFQLNFDVAVGEGYACDEVGKYPNYSAKNVCVNDLRKNDGLVCQVPIRADEFDRRALALGFTPSSSSSSSSSSSVSTGTGSSQSSVSSASSEDSSMSSFVAFPDVAEGKYGYTAITDLASRKIIRGYADGLFRPKNAVNRAEFTKLLMQTLHADEIQGETGCFRDVHDEWFSGVVCAAKRLEWVSGFSDTTFRPAQSMKKAEAMKVIIHALGASVDSEAVLPEGVADNQWYTPFIRKAVELDIILEPSFQPNAEMTRADAAVWLFRALKAQSSGVLQPGA